MSVIVGRALPRRSRRPETGAPAGAVCMRELGNDWNKAYKKSARVVGDVIGKYHPHGDASVYDAIVRMAQHFSMRICWSTARAISARRRRPAGGDALHPKCACRSSPRAAGDIDKETVDFNPNYDESESEPAVLPDAYTESPDQRLIPASRSAWRRTYRRTSDRNRHRVHRAHREARPHRSRN